MRCKGEVEIRTQRNERGNHRSLHAAWKIALERTTAALELINTVVCMCVCVCVCVCVGDCVGECVGRWARVIQSIQGAEYEVIKSQFVFKNADFSSNKALVALQCRSSASAV